MKSINYNMYSLGTLRISNVLNRLLHEFLDLTPAINLIILFCNVLLDELPPQNYSILYCRVKTGKMPFWYFIFYGCIIYTAAFHINKNVRMNDCSWHYHNVRSENPVKGANGLCGLSCPAVRQCLIISACKQNYP
jgi:hypothetical protein